MSNKKIAFFSVHACPLAFEEGKEVGGLNVYIMMLARELIKLGYTIDIFTRSENPTSQRIVDISANLRIVHLKAGPEETINKKQMVQYLDEFTSSFLDFVEKNQLEYNIFHAHYYLSGIVCSNLKRIHFQSTPIIIAFHTLAIMKNLVGRDELEREGKERITFEISLIKEADSIIALSESDKEYLLFLYDCPKQKITVVNPGVDKTIFKPISKALAKSFIKADPADKVILFVGRVEPLKGMDMLLYAIKILLTKNPKLKIGLWVVGEDLTQEPHLWSKELQRLEELRDILNISTVVKFVGQQSQHDLAYYYNASEMVVMPSHYETFGMVALEAMACGVPVITTNVSGITSLLGSKYQVLITSVSNPLFLASQMEFLLTHEKERKIISRQLLEHSLSLIWKNVARKTSSVYERLL